MDIQPSQRGYEHILVFMGLQGAKEGVIKSEYSGTVRLADYTASDVFIKKCIAAWLTYAVNTVDYTQRDIVIVVPTVTANTVDEIFADMLVKGYITYDTQHSVYEFSSLNRVFGYVLTSEANIPDWGVIAWGNDGIGATYSSSDIVTPDLIDDGVAYEQYIAQFPQHGITGSDIILVMPGAVALQRLITGWKPQYKEIVQAIRANLPVI